MEGKKGGQGKGMEGKKEMDGKAASAFIKHKTCKRRKRSHDCDNFLAFPSIANWEHVKLQNP